MTQIESKEDRLIEYESWRESLRSCELCDLHKTRTQVVVDSGLPGARLAVIGECPGKEEDRLGEVFIGRSGQLLRDLMKQGGIVPWRDATLFNILRCRPPNNRFPRPEVAQTCQQHTRRQLELLQPEICVLAGRQAARWILFPSRDLTAGQVVGKTYWSSNWPFVRYFQCVYHPAYIIRKHGQERDRLEEETIAIFRQIKEDLDRPQIPMRGKPIGQIRQEKVSLF